MTQQIKKEMVMQADNAMNNVIPMRRGPVKLHSESVGARLIEILESADHPLSALQVQAVFVSRFALRPTIATVRTWLSRLSNQKRIQRASTGRYARLSWSPEVIAAKTAAAQTQAFEAGYRAWLVEWFISQPIHALTSAGLRARYRKGRRHVAFDRAAFNRALEGLASNGFLDVSSYRGQNVYLLSGAAHSIFQT